MNSIMRRYVSRPVRKTIVVGKTNRDDLRKDTDIEILSGSGAVFGDFKDGLTANFRSKAAEGILVEISKLKGRSV